MNEVKFDFTGNNYVVTGASSGMGRQVAIELAEAGAKVLAVARREEKLRELQSMYADNICVAALDVCDSEQMENAIKDFVAEYGKLDGGVHAAGIIGFTPLKIYDRALAESIMDISFWAGVELARLVTKAKYGQKATSTVLFSSVSAENNVKGMFAYSAAKAAVNGCLGSLAKEIAAKGHRINSIMPGVVKTGMTDAFSAMSNSTETMGRELLGIGTPEDVSGMVLFLLSDRARWITGTSLAVDGGFLA